MAQLQLRPMGVGEIITASLTVYARRWRTLLAVAGVLILPYAVLYLALAEPPPTLSLDPTNDEARQFLSTMGPWLLIRLFILTIMLAAVIRTTMETYVGVESGWRQAAAAAISKMVALTVVAVLFWSAAVMGFTLFVLPGRLPGGVLQRVPACPHDRGCGPGRGPGAVVADDYGPEVAGTGGAAPLVGPGGDRELGSLPGRGVAAVRTLGGLGLSVASELVWVALQPFIGVALAVMYLDLRVRKEDLDAEWLSLQLSATSFDR